MLAGSTHTQKRCPVSVLAKVVKIMIQISTAFVARTVISTS